VWESLTIESSELFSSVLGGFPPLDLAQNLINLYFLHVNIHVPLLHRPTFDRQWRENLHHKNIWFAGVCVTLFAVASRFTDDPRVIKDGGKTASGTPDWGLAGWSYFEVGIGQYLNHLDFARPYLCFQRCRHTSCSEEFILSRKFI
jgi:hypothetical protein